MRKGGRENKGGRVSGFIFGSLTFGSSAGLVVHPRLRLAIALPSP